MFKKVYSLYSAFYPSLRFTLSLQSAFYTQSAFYPWSAVCSPRFTLTDKLISMSNNNVASVSLKEGDKLHVPLVLRRGIRREGGGGGPKTTMLQRKE